MDLITDSPIIDFPKNYASYPASPLVKIADSATFSFTLTTSTPWSGDYRFLVDGVKYLYSEHGSLSPDARGFTAGQLDSLGLQHNNGLGYPTPGAAPIPGSVLLMGSGLLGLVGFRWRCRKK
ncbi:MAG: hypothetical protein NTW80_09290 [Deltaproteobacteria bacterium]|nr:hypothetical protein [Deltaproteobacteria bacterium]